jgi:hypothetical protein
MNGIKFVTERYFYNGNLETSVGAQRQPIIHLSLGIQYKLPGVVAQALAYLSSTYKVVDFLTSSTEYDEYSDDGLSEDDDDFQVTYRCSAYEIVMEQIKHDPRFNILLTTKHRNDKQSIFDTVLRNQQFLLRTYISSWRINDTKSALSELRTLATQIMAGSHVLKDSRILLETIMALDVLYPNNSCPAEIVRIQFLTFICSYIALGLPSAGQKESNGSIHDWLNQLLEGEEGRNIHMICTLFTLKEAFGVDQSLIYKHVLSSF